jgi:hypothetical protein
MCRSSTLFSTFVSVNFAPPSRTLPRRPIQRDSLLEVRILAHNIFIHSHVANAMLIGEKEVFVFGAVLYFPMSTALTALEKESRRKIAKENGNCRFYNSLRGWREFGETEIYFKRHFMFSK